MVMVVVGCGKGVRIGVLTNVEREVYLRVGLIFN